MPNRQVLPVYVMVGHILALFRAGSQTYGYGRVREWAQWYVSYRTIITDIAVQYDIPFEHAAGAFAWLSARSQLVINVRNLIAMCEAYRNGTDPYATVTHTRQFIGKAWECINGDLSSMELGERTNSRKIRTFYRNLCGDEFRVTIDAHAVAIAMGAGTDTNTTFGQPSGMGYRNVERAYQSAASVLNMTPAQLQAAVWCIRRGDAN